MCKQVLMLKVGGALGEGKSPYEATCGNWNLSGVKVKNGEIKYVIGIDNRNHKVVGVYEPRMWYEVVWIGVGINSNEMPRYRFDGIESNAFNLDDLNHVYENLVNRFGVGSEKNYISITELNDLIASAKESI
jgi:hypothetical protein